MIIQYLRLTLPILGIVGLITLGNQSVAAERAETTAASQRMVEQSAALPMGTIHLRVIPFVGGKTLKGNIDWQVMTYGRDSSGKRKHVADVSGPTPELVLPAGWYVVHARLPDKVIKHPVEVTANRTFKYTLVKN